MRRVTLLVGDGQAREFGFESDNRAISRGRALAELHSARMVIRGDQIIVDAVDYYKNSGDKKG